MPTPGSPPFDVSVYVSGSDIPIRIPKGSDVTVTFTVVKYSGETEVVFQKSLFQMDPNAPLVRLAKGTD